MTRNAKQDRYAGATALCLVVFAVSLVLLAGCKPNEEGNSVTVTEESDSAPPAPAPTPGPLSSAPTPTLNSDEIALTPQARQEKYGTMGRIFLGLLDRHGLQYRTEGDMIRLGRAVCPALKSLDPLEIATRIDEGTYLTPKESGMLVGAAIGTLCMDADVEHGFTETGSN